MSIYNYLFFKSYLLAQRSRNFDDVPILGGILFVIPCVMFNLFALFFLLEGFGIIDNIKLPEKYKFIFTGGLVILLLLYYFIGGNYKKIISKYEEKLRNKKQLHPLLVFFIYYSLSFAVLLISALFKNQDWIFAQ